MPEVLTAADNLFDYFHAKVQDAHADAPVDLAEDTLLYLARLLTEQARTDRPRLPEDTLAELFGRASNAPPSEQIAAYRELGDRSLYLLGCFSESLEGRIVGPSYYRDMGAAAYWRVDRVVERWFRSAFGPVFRELAVCFPGCVELLDLVRSRHDEEHPDALMRLFTKWRETGSPELARRLRGLGIQVSDLDPA